MSATTLKETTSRDETEIRALLDAFASALYDKNSAAAVAVFSDNAVRFEAGTAAAHRGRAIPRFGLVRCMV